MAGELDRDGGDGDELARDGAGRDADAEDGVEGAVAQDGEEPLVAPGRKAAALWALVGALTFGVLYQGAVLTGLDFEVVVLVGGMLAVGLATYALATVLQPRLPGAAQ